MSGHQTDVSCHTLVYIIIYILRRWRIFFYKKILSCWDKTVENDRLHHGKWYFEKKKKKKSDILYGLKAFIMPIVFATKISQLYVFISERVILFKSENFFNKGSFLDEIRRNFGNPQFCFFEIFLVKNNGKSLPKKNPRK